MPFRCRHVSVPSDHEGHVPLGSSADRSGSVRARSTSAVFLTKGDRTLLI